MNGSSSDPVNISDHFGGFVLSSDSSVRFISKIDRFEFFFGKIGEMVDGHFVGLGRIGIVRVDHGFVGHEDGLSVSFFFKRVLFSVGCFE